MKKKIIIISIVTLVILVSGVLVILLNSKDNENVNTKILDVADTNTSVNEDAKDESLIQDALPLDDTNNEVVPVIENTTSDESNIATSNKEITDPLKSSSNTDNKKTSQTPSKNNTETTKNQNNNNNKTKTETTPKSTTPTDVSSVPKTTPTQSTKYWCYEGGTHHTLGTASYEHGYYSDGETAQKEMNKYMKNLNSGNYYIDQCDCGLFYFGVKEN